MNNKSNIELSKKIVNSLLILLLGIVLGIFSKWLDNLSIDETIWWQHILEILDLRNVFSEFGIWIFLGIVISVFSEDPKRAGLNVFLFFIGMTTSYHLYTVLFCGFNPMNYMMIWYGITLLSPVMAFICWYARGNSIMSIVFSIIILTVMLLFSFGIGLWYFDFRGVIDTLLFLGTISVLAIDIKKCCCNLIGSVILSFILRIFL